MSKLIVEVCAVEEIAPHPNADRIERVRIKNWWCIAGKDSLKVGDKVVYVPPDAVLPNELAERWGIAKYCSSLAKLPNGDVPPGLRVRACRFRGVPSCGTIQPLDDPSWEVGKDVCEHYGITKYEPPVKSHDGDAACDVPAFHKYTDIENIGNYPGVFQDGEMVFVTEKLHGTNCRVGLVFSNVDNPDGQPEWTLMAGSHSVRRKKVDAKGKMSRYWLPLENENIKQLLACAEGFTSPASSAVIVFGEIFGPGVQDMTYGLNEPSFRVFDISVDGRYLDFSVVQSLCRQHGVETVPVLYLGPFSQAKMDELVDGPTTISDSSQIKEPFKGREGIVIKPVQEAYDHSRLGGRKILKQISIDYHERKNKGRSEDH